MTATTISAANALDLSFESRDLYETLTVRDYMKRLLTTLFEEGEGFSGKRPFGNSGWEYDIARPLISGGYISGEIDSDGCVEDFDEDEFQRGVRLLIAAL